MTYLAKKAVCVLIIPLEY